MVQRSPPLIGGKTDLSVCVVKLGDRINQSCITVSTIDAKDQWKIHDYGNSSDKFQYEASDWNDSLPYVL